MQDRCSTRDDGAADVAISLNLGDELLMQRIELIGACRDRVVGERILEPQPLEHGGFEQGRGRVGVVFEKPRRAIAIVGEIEAAIECVVVATPALGDQVPGVPRNPQTLQGSLIANRSIDQGEAERGQLLGGIFDMALDLLQGEAVVGALVPIDVAVHAQELEAGLARPLRQIVTWPYADAPHALDPLTSLNRGRR